MARTGSKHSRGSRGRAGFSRALKLLAFLPVATRIPTYARLVTALVLDDRMPASRKALLAGAAGYLVLGRDLIPDNMPILGGIDDLVDRVAAAVAAHPRGAAAGARTDGPAGAGAAP